MVKSADIVIIGGGVHGASLAFHLARRNAGRIVLLEKNYLCAGPTAKSGAMIRPLFTEQVYVDLVVRSTRMFEHFDEIVGGAAGFVQKGWLRISESLDVETLGGDLALVDSLNEPYDILDVDALARLAPTAEFQGRETGLLFPNGGFADPVLTTLQLAEAARRRGVDIIEGVEVRAIDTGHGRITSVTTSEGRIDTPLIVNCAGVWSHRVAKMAGVTIPIEVHRTPTCLFRWPEPMRIDGPVLSDGINRVYLRELGSGLLRAAHFGWSPDPADPDDYDETIARHQMEVLRQGADARYTAMRRTPYFGGFSALYDMMPDGHPIVGPIPQVEGFWCDCGWSGNGFAPALAAGEALAATILGETTDVDLSLFAWPRPANIRARADLKWVYR